MSENKLKIAFLTSTNAQDRRSWSGIHYYIAKALKHNIGEVDYLGPIDLRFHFLKGKVISFFLQKIFKKRFDYLHSYSTAKLYAKKIGKKLEGKNYDLIFAPAASSEIAFLKTNIPIVYLSDTTYANMIDYYPYYSNLLKISKKQGNEIDKRAIKNARINLFPSIWAANSAIKDYQADKSKVYIIPLGANIDEAPKIELILQKKKTDTCRLLFLGVEWERKGGEIAFNTFVKLNDWGINTELVVCGCQPPQKFSHNKMKVIPFINKNDKKQYQEFEQLLLNSDFLILPTQAECYGIVFCEASAYGLPNIASNTGGVNGAIINGENGYVLPPQSNAENYAKLISEIFCNDEKYYALIKSSRKVFENKLNWDVWALEVKKIIYANIKVN